MIDNYKIDDVAKLLEEERVTFSPQPLPTRSYLVSIATESVRFREGSWIPVTFEDDMGNTYRTSLKKILNAEGLVFSKRSNKARVSALFRIAESGSKEERFFYLEDIVPFEIKKRGIVAVEGLDGKQHYCEGIVGYIQMKRYKFREKIIDC
ncbi:hypothetical protein [Prevotella sp. E2-28]|uniref:hypothetical protein n=1 Tax=Prevotella sp. E2-28 TaxID=2913620 RepID=UPI001EDA41F6|nr:hypothetical protein [Prevotella sp. E2-28]UKK52732.1 hypothetical protein L6465_09000 [Prevotella sp. E2-28]